MLRLQLATRYIPLVSPSPKMDTKNVKEAKGHYYALINI